MLNELYTQDQTFVSVEKLLIGDLRQSKKIAVPIFNLNIPCQFSPIDQALQGTLYLHGRPFEKRGGFPGFCHPQRFEV
jgi:hypothetical protein